MKRDFINLIDFTEKDLMSIIKSACRWKKERDLSNRVTKKNS